MKSEKEYERFKRSTSMRGNKMDLNLLILIMAIKFYFVYGLASAALGFWWARENIQKIIAKRKAEGETHLFVSLVALFVTSVIIWPYILCASIRLSIMRKTETLK